MNISKEQRDILLLKNHYTNQKIQIAKRKKYFKKLIDSNSKLKSFSRRSLSKLKKLVYQ